MMAVVGETSAAGRPAATGHAAPGAADGASSWWRRQPAVAHAAALLVVLLALLPIIGTDAQFSADEGAALAGAVARAETGSWGIPHPLPAFDGDGSAFPLEKSQPVAGGYAPFPKRPLYLAVLVGLYDLGGVVATVLLSLLATVVAAVLTGRIARRLHPALEIPALWVAGLASPLFFDGYLVMAHTVGAALAAGAVLAALRAADRGRIYDIALVGACVGVLVLVRSEGLLFGAALAAAVGWWWVRDRRREVLLMAVTAGKAVGLAVLANSGAERWLFGSGQPPAVRGGSQDWLAGRWQALLNTWLRPGYGLTDAQGALVLMTFIVGVVAVVLVRRRRPDASVVLFAAALTAVLAVLSLVIDTPGVVPGLLMAFPVGVWGIALLPRQAVAAGPGLVLAVAGAMFALAVLGTEYPTGGGAEWGGRYFAVGLVVAVPLAVEGYRAAAARFGPEARRRLTGCLMVVAAVSVAAMVLSLRDSHQATADVNEAIGAAIAVAGSDPADPRPVVVSPYAAYPRLGWQTLDDGRWVLVRRVELVEELDRLAALGVESLVYVSVSGKLDAELVASSDYAVSASLHGGPGQSTTWVAVLSRAS